MIVSLCLLIIYLKTKGFLTCLKCQVGALRSFCVMKHVAFKGIHNGSANRKADIMQDYRFFLTPYMVYVCVCVCVCVCVRVCMWVCACMHAASAYYFILLAICSQSCNHGNCTSPNTCSCEEGWTSSVCNKGIKHNIIIHLPVRMKDSLKNCMILHNKGKHQKNSVPHKCTRGSANRKADIMQDYVLYRFFIWHTCVCVCVCVHAL